MGLLIFTFAVDYFDFDLEHIFRKNKSALAVFGFYHHTEFKNDILKSVNCEQTNRQTEPITCYLRDYGNYVLKKILPLTLISSCFQNNRIAFFLKVLNSSAVRVFEFIVHALSPLKLNPGLNLILSLK